jgi:hypothetical protein
MNKERLLKLATHLESGKLGCDEFDYTTIYSNDNGKIRRCAIGECPIVWPKDWCDKITYVGVFPVLRNSTLDSMDSACEWFDIGIREAVYLFCPKQSETEYTAYQVADKIKKFVNSH